LAALAELRPATGRHFLHGDPDGGTGLPRVAWSADGQARAGTDDVFGGGAARGGIGKAGHFGSGVVADLRLEGRFPLAVTSGNDLGLLRFVGGRVLRVAFRTDHFGRRVAAIDASVGAEYAGGGGLGDRWFVVVF